MTAMAASAPAAAPAEAAPWAIMVTAMLGTFMTVLDSTIANVALPHMQPSLNAAADTISWVLTSYIVATAIAIPLTGWLAARIGRRRLFLISVAAFTTASLACGLAQSLEQMVLFRMVQGAAGSFLAPLGQAYVLDAFPAEKQGPANAWWGVGVMVGPILGPVIGGWLTDSFDWRWVFLINLPFGIICFAMAAALLPEPKLPPRRFDGRGFLMLALGVGALQLCLDRGQQLDWLDSWEVRVEAGLAMIGLWLFAVHSYHTPGGLLDARLLRDRNAASGFIFITLVGVLMMATNALLPPMLETLFGYPVVTTGFTQMPRGVGMMITMWMAGQLVGRFDPRLLVGVGLLANAAALWGMSWFSPDQGQGPFLLAGFVQGAGLGLVFVPLNVLAFSTLPLQLRTDAAAFYMLLRNLGGSIGISLGVALLARQVQVSHSELGAALTPYALPWAEPGALKALGLDAVAAMLDGAVNRQAAMIAYLDIFRSLAWLTLAVVPLLLLVRRPKSRERVDLPE